MANYKKQSTTTGSWIKASELVGVKTAVIVSETTPQPSQFYNKDGSVKMQDVCKIKFEGKNEAFNISLNRTNLNGLVDAFGEDSVKWQNKPLGVETEKVRVAGKAVTAVYLIPEGYERIDNQDGFAEIRKIGGSEVKEDVPMVDVDEIEVKDIPF
jgi:hypothetical protein